LESSTGRSPQFVFAYGSLATGQRVAPTREWDPRGFVADLIGYRRTWGVAMDNRRDLSGYKYYTDAGGRRPEVFVAFLDLWAAPDGAVVNGLCLPVDATRLAALDRRERNYDRIDVTDRLAVSAGAPGGARVWTYVGSPAGRRRLRQARAAGAAVIDANYLRAVRNAFARLGEAERRACAASLDTRDLPVVPLRRHELP
jgi:gamma-glutamylcyclotransferase (GGCT)/AIG2-like uncharacterized protein YtfP